MMLDEKAIPVKPVVAAACEFLGLDPLYVANEGKLIAICAAADAERLLAAMRAHPPVSYTHLDVYKRQRAWSAARAPVLHTIAMDATRK